MVNNHFLRETQQWNEPTISMNIEIQRVKLDVASRVTLRVQFVRSAPFFLHPSWAVINSTDRIKQTNKRSSNAAAPF